MRDARRVSGGFFDLSTSRRRVDELDALIAAAGFWQHPQAQALARERARLGDAIDRSAALSCDVAACTELAAIDDGEALEADVADLEARLAAIEADHGLTAPEDRLGAIVEVHAGAGGLEAADWCRTLLRMYARWAASHGRTVEIMDQTETEDGVRGATFLIGGAGAFGRLRGETGVHRLVRVSPYDAAGRRHTSFASVTVTPDLDDRVDIVVRDGDYLRESFCSGGPGGQNVNKVASAVRLTHKATGIAVKCQTERSQQENFRLAMKALKGRLFDLESRRREEEFAVKYGHARGNVAFGQRARSYVLDPYQSVKDQRCGYESHDVRGVLDGAIDPMLDAVRGVRASE